MRANVPGKCSVCACMCVANGGPQLARTCSRPPACTAVLPADERRHGCAFWTKNLTQHQSGKWRALLLAVRCRLSTASASRRTRMETRCCLWLFPVNLTLSEARGGRCPRVYSPDCRRGAYGHGLLVRADGFDDSALY